MHVFGVFKKNITMSSCTHGLERHTEGNVSDVRSISCAHDDDGADDEERERTHPA